MNEAVLGWLRERGAESVPHAGGSLYAHLGRVADRLAGHGASEAECRAALTHAAYGTDGFPVVLLDVVDRAVLRALIGAEAEEMVYRYGGCDRGRTWRALPATGVIWNRFTGNSAAPTPAELRAFADLSIVNELDVYERSPEIAEKAGDYFRSVFPTWEPITSPAVMDDARRVLGL
jgi:hypothetical protein